MNVGATPERPYVCEHCNQAFSRQHNLKSHYFVHSGERPFKCETCQQAFTRHHDLKRHIRSIHTGLKPYQCPNCKRAFARLDALNRHLRVSGNAPCVGMNNPRKSYTKHKKGEKGKNSKANAEKNDKKTEGDNANDNAINEEVSTEVSNVEIPKNTDISTNDKSEVNGIEDEVNSPPAIINEVPEKQTSPEKETSKRGKATKVNQNNNNTMNEPIQNKNDEIEDISNLRNNIIHGPKKTLLPPKSLKPPQRRNQKRKNNMNGNDNVEIVSTMIVPPNKNNKANIPYANNNNGAIPVDVNNDSIDISDKNKSSKKRKITNNKSKNTIESDIIDLGTDLTDSSQFTIPVRENVQPYTVTADKIVSYTNQTIDTNNNTEQNGNGDVNVPTNAKAIKAILDRNEYLENQLKDFKNEFYNFKKVQERLEQMEYKIKELEREKGVLRDMLNEKDQQNIKMRNSILSSTSSPIHGNNNSGNNSNSVSNSINNINSISSMSDVSNIDNSINGMNNYNNSSNPNIGYLATTNIVSSSSKNYNAYNKNYNAYKENGNYNTTSFIPSQIIENSSQPAYTIESDKSMSNLQNSD